MKHVLAKAAVERKCVSRRHNP